MEDLSKPQIVNFFSLINAAPPMHRPRSRCKKVQLDSGLFIGYKYKFVWKFFWHWISLFCITVNQPEWSMPYVYIIESLIKIYI